MPEIRKLSAKAVRSGRVNDMNDQSIKWMPHTEIALKTGGGRVKKINSKPQTTMISQLLHHSYPISDCYLVFGGLEDKSIEFSELKTMETPMQKDHVNKIVFKALVEATEKLGYDGEGDIADRLERGSYNDYTKPLMAYVCSISALQCLLLLTMPVIIGITALDPEPDWHEEITQFCSRTCVPTD